MRRPIVLAIALLVPAVPGRAATIALPPVQDATLVEDPNGALANGAGEGVFSGRTNAPDNGVRRGLFRFDPASGLPRVLPTAIEIESVALVLTNVTESNVTPAEYRLHRVLADWGEGPSSSGGGGGAPSEPGDATWIQAFYPDVFWMHNGAQFAGEPSARLVVAGPGVYRFEGNGLLQDVRLWLREPGRNFGWILIGDETRRQTVRAFASREHPDPDLRPVLEINYRTGR